MLFYLFFVEKITSFELTSVFYQCYNIFVKILFPNLTPAAY